MSTKKIAELTNVSSVQDTDLLIVETSNGTRSIKKGDLVSDIVEQINDIAVPTALSQLAEDSTHRLVTDAEKSTWNAKANGDHNHSGLAISPNSIELTPTSGVNHGGFIDFHFNGNSSDFTSRIIESASGQLTLQAKVNVVDPPIGTACARNIYAGTTDLTAGSSSLTTGAIYLVYE